MSAKPPLRNSNPAELFRHSFPIYEDSGGKRPPSDRVFYSCERGRTVQRIVLLESSNLVLYRPIVDFCSLRVSFKGRLTIHPATNLKLAAKAGRIQPASLPNEAEPKDR